MSRGPGRRRRMIFGTARSFCTSSLAFVAIGMASISPAAEQTPLDRYLAGLKTLRAAFTQTLVDANDRVVDRAQGTLVVMRPGKFRWEVRPQEAGAGGEQLLVADGRNVWFFDEELEQVTVKPADTALSSTPAMLLSGAGNVRDQFKVTAAGARDGLEWVLVEPLAAEADFRRALLGFQKDRLARMIVDDKLGQTATISFASATRNGPVAPEEVSFKAPAGADVIGTPAG
jgi:outer membrane lipoprotein carrier protein